VTVAAPGEGDVFAPLIRPTRIWAVGAIHGEADRLDRLQQQLGDRLAPGDRLVYLGGFLGYGPDVSGTLDRLIAFRREFLARKLVFTGDIIFVRGSQEEIWQKLLQLQFAPNPREVLEWMLDHGVGATLDAYGCDRRQGMAAARDGPLALTRWTASLRAAIDARPGHRQLLTSVKRAAYSAPDGMLFVHAGVDPAKPLDLQRDMLWWGDVDILELTQPYSGFRRVVRGRDRKQGGLKMTEYAASIDGGSGFGGTLLAAGFAPDGTFLELIEA
jgi:serine/threonine protein phosphatase 1